MRYAFLSLLLLIACVQEAKRPDGHAKCVTTLKHDDGTPIARLCEWHGYLWQCDPQDCVRLHRVDEPKPEAP